MNAIDLSFFRRSGDALVPTDMARSMWDDDQMHGVAVSGALARAAERCLAERGREDLRPARYTVDLFRAARMTESLVAAEVVREGPRILLVDVVLTQGGTRVARAGVVFLKPSESTAGTVWSPPAAERPVPPPLDVAPPTREPHVPFIHSSAGWSQSFGAHQNAARKQSWNTAIPVVAGEPGTPFQAVAAIADGASLVTNWGDRGVEHINTDITLALSRLPVDLSVGLAAVDRVEHDGIAVGTAAVLDREGPIGTVVVTSLANAKRSVDIGGVEYADDGSRTRG
ncbi:acyl-CoA thioesterase domain-containing protein [Nocardioides dongkuii]|uniref:acyl-CoA thioesterase domain-containing protein n=1 Tax=Nocardioides dongkuii TaxID=2760089 RepID=UPI0015FA8F71|nr:acyl-CoA thioesterase domain-containing protein [Nocardioides dongkuii]